MTRVLQWALNIAGPIAVAGASDGILEWTKLVWTPAPGSLFVILSFRMSTHVERNNYVPLFGVDIVRMSTYVIT